jgi:hypothetical protein
MIPGRTAPQPMRDDVRWRAIDDWIMRGNVAHGKPGLRQ